MKRNNYKLTTAPNDLTESNINRFDYKSEKFKEVKNVKPNKKYTVLETFAGAGGLALGLEKSGLSSVGALELDKNAAQTLRDNRPNWNVIENDISIVADKGIKNYITTGNVDVLSGGWAIS